MGFSDYFGMSDNHDTLKPYVDKAISTFETGNIAQLQNEDWLQHQPCKRNIATTTICCDSILYEVLC